MRYLRLLLIPMALTLAIGCTFLQSLGHREPEKKRTPVEKVSAEQLVGYLNDRAGRLQSLNGEAKITAREGLVPYPTLRGNLAASQPRNFRMTGQGGAMGAKVDFGSNPELFWVYFDAPTMKPMFVYASHSDFESGRAKLPGGIPFEPEWVMQALGMTTFAPNGQYQSTMNEKDRTYTLSWPATTPNGLAIRKEVVFDADEAREGRPQVKKHLVRDGKGKLLCSAEIKSAKTVALGSPDPRSAQVAVQYPTHVVLRWEEQRFEMDLGIDAAQVNQRMSEEQGRRLFTRPSFPGIPPIDLARYEFPSK